jgi:hypothetical protein
VLIDLQRALAQRYLAGRPSEPRADPAAPANLSAEEISELANLDADALAIQRLVLTKLRLQRLLTNPQLAAEFQRDPGAFWKRFAAYDRSVTPRAFMDRDEQADFARYCSPEDPHRT